MKNTYCYSISSITLEVNIFKQMCTHEESDKEVGTVNGKWDSYKINNS